jgi:hypothetical protein
VSYEDSLAKIRAMLRRDGLPVAPCLWGEEHGVSLRKGGISIPDFDATRSIIQPGDEDKDLALWAALYRDPLCEFRLLQSKYGQSAGFIPNRITAYQQLDPLLQRLRPSGDLSACLQRCRLVGVWDEAMRAVIESPEYRQTMQKESDVTSGIRYAIARALVAQAFQFYFRRFEDEADWPSGKDRDELVELIVAELGGAERGLKESLFKTLIAWPTTFYARPRRGRLSEQGFAAAGDILYYQVRGQAIRDFIRRRVESVEAPVTLLAHSLGGIACVDLLIERHLPKIERLITVGSQAPFLYEMDALVGLRYGQPLPAHFPKRWLNIYDPRDFLSYLARGVFSGPEIEIADVRVNNRQPFPQSHTSYWDNDEVFKAILEELA